MNTASFKAMGTTVNLAVDGAPAAKAEPLLSSGRQFIEDFDAALSRFSPDSELTALNVDPREEVEVSWLMTEFISAALWAAESSGGLVDATVLRALERNGYEQSRADAIPASLSEALDDAPEPRPAHADPTAAWKLIELDRAARVVRRPPGLLIDSGGAGKGLAADLLARKWSLALGGGAGYMVDCGGDIRFGGLGNRAGYVNVEDPIGDRSLRLDVANGGVATTSIRKRIWRNADGAPAHHLIDPSTGAPAWTGVVAVTAVAPSALVAETLSKIAFLRGPDGARETLTATGGGLIVLADGTVEQVNPEFESAAA